MRRAAASCCGFHCGVTSIWIGERRVADTDWTNTARNRAISALGSGVRRPQRCCWRSAGIFEPSTRPVRQGRRVCATARRWYAWPGGRWDGWDVIGRMTEGIPTGFSRARSIPTNGAGPLWASRHGAMRPCANSGRGRIDRNLRSGRTVATPRYPGKLWPTPRSPCCGPATWKPSGRERGFAGPCSSRWTTIPSRVPVRLSKAWVPRLPGRSSCTATSGRLRTAGPFPASPRIPTMPQVMAACAFVGIGRCAKNCCFLCCRASLPTRLPESTSARRGCCWMRSSAPPWSRTTWPWSGDGIGCRESSSPKEFDGKRWTRVRASFCQSRNGVRRRKSSAGGSRPRATNARAMSYSSTKMPLELRMNSTTGPKTTWNVC